MSSSESEDENLKRFAQSVDTSVFSNNLYSDDPKPAKEEPKVELKSQRFLDDEENVFKSEINVSKTMQQFIGKKMSKLIDDQLEFVELKKKDDDGEVVDNVRLFSGTKEVVRFIHEPTSSEPQKKVEIKRRKVDDNEELKESVKIRKAAIDSTAIQAEVKSWSKKTKHEPTEYKTIKGISYIREPQNEFTKARNKNSWTESKIQGAKLHNPPMCDLIKK